MKLKFGALFVVVALLSGCVGIDNEPLVASLDVLDINFISQSDYETVSSHCSITGPDFDISFAAPSKISVPYRDGQIDISEITCWYNGVQKTMSVFPAGRIEAIGVDFMKRDQFAYFWYTSGTDRHSFNANGIILVEVS